MFAFEARWRCVSLGHGERPGLVRVLAGSGEVYDIPSELVSLAPRRDRRVPRCRIGRHPWVFARRFPTYLLGARWWVCRAATSATVCPSGLGAISGGRKVSTRFRCSEGRGSPACTT